MRYLFYARCRYSAWRCYAAMPCIARVIEMMTTTYGSRAVFRYAYGASFMLRCSSSRNTFTLLRQLATLDCHVIIISIALLPPDTPLPPVATPPYASATLDMPFSLPPCLLYVSSHGDMINSEQACACLMLYFCGARLVTFDAASAARRYSAARMMAIRAPYARSIMPREAQRECTRMRRVCRLPLRAVARLIRGLYARCHIAAAVHAVRSAQPPPVARRRRCCARRYAAAASRCLMPPCHY